MPKIRYVDNLPILRNAEQLILIKHANTIIREYLRGTAEYLGGTRVRFTWPCGHTQVKDFNTGPIPKRIGSAGCKFLARYWSHSGGGVNLPRCPRCRDAAP